MENLIFDMGNIDLPYEMCGLSMGYTGDKSKFFVFAHFQGADNKMAEYSSPEKARKAMEMLRAEFENYYWIKTTGNSEELKQIARMLNHDEFKKMTTSYFQFPSDDEVEV